jgi:hypothetical protein
MDSVRKLLDTPSCFIGFDVQLQRTEILCCEDNRITDTTLHTENVFFVFQPSIQFAQGWDSFLWGVRLPGREADHSPPSSAEVISTAR